MKFKNILFGILIIYVTFEIVYTKQVESDYFFNEQNENVSYVESVNFEHKNGKWICGDIDCPEKTFGCKIRLRSDKEDRKVLYQSFTCIDKDQNSLLGSGDIIKLKKEKDIDIQLKTYEGAVSVYGVGYGLGGNENAEGVVSVNDLPELKESFRKNKKRIDGQNIQN